jgi:adenine-specific DNA-methyltransferase
MARQPKAPKVSRNVDALVHDETRRNIPTAEFESVAQQLEEQAPIRPARYNRTSSLAPGDTRPRDMDQDPQLVWRGMRIRLTGDQISKLHATGEVELGDAQLVWRGKDAQDWSDLVVNAPPIYIQEKVHPKAIIDGLQKESCSRANAATNAPDLFGDFNGLTDPEARLEFYKHDQHWSNRMILGDSLQVMASLAEREGLRGKVQCIYLDPPYGIKFNSNWQVSTESRDVKDGKREDVSREPEQVKAFRDTWKDGIHSYLTYLRDRLTVARELLTKSGAIFVQISDENQHRVRAVMDEVFGVENFVAQIIFSKTAGATSKFLPGTYDILLMYARSKDNIKFHPPYKTKSLVGDGGSAYNRLRSPDQTWRALTKAEKSGSTPIPDNSKVYRIDNLTSQSVGREKGEGAASWFPVEVGGQTFRPSMKARWKTSEAGMAKLVRAGRLEATADGLYYVRYFDDFPVYAESDIWTDTSIAGFASDKRYVVETSTKVVQRCLLMTTDPGDLVLDPTCGSGTTATVAEQWGRRWITIDTSRVALALARTRLMSAKYPYYFLADSREGRAREQAVSGRVQPDTLTHENVRHGFVYERVPHVTLKSIANNIEIDILWDEAQQTLEPLRCRLNAALGEDWEEWQIPREASSAWVSEARKTHAEWWIARLERQRRIDASIARKADVEFLYDRPYEDKARVRVAGPFTVESLSPHRVVPADEDQLLDAPRAPYRNRRDASPPVDFAVMVLDYLRTAGVHQTQKADSIRFTSLQPWPGVYIGAEGRFLEGNAERRAGILLGPEFGTLSRTDLVTAAREASDARFDVLIACAFNYDAHAAELTKLGPMRILKARMNPDLHMADDLKNTGRGNMFVVFGEPDLVVEAAPGNADDIQIRIIGVDVFDPQTGDIRSGDTKSIAAWFIDTDYNEESFFVRHAYFLGDQDPYKALKAAMRAEIDEDAWATLYRDTSRPFQRPETGRIAVKVINHFGDEVMKVFTV